ncbi:RNA 2'-phosphotransferase [Flaviaesturariibacter amylovorans]|uniref:Probable RNA 2'-phosphotransferase n=1 Tax=Flaviaesturariibacter amylovorans TaxID=1084520 RepID=A0ABP8HSS5_9BACT
MSSDVRISKFLSLVLRHDPARIGITLDAGGWTPVDELLRCLTAAGMPLTRASLDALVATNPKQRFAYNDDRTCIRASQGHSVPVALGYEPLPPPEVLYHGTANRFLEAILREGLNPGARHGVHLSADVATARSVGGRHGTPVVLEVAAAAMAADGFSFTRSENGVWITDAVPPQYLKVI